MAHWRLRAALVRAEGRVGPQLGPQRTSRPLRSNALSHSLEQGGIAVVEKRRHMGSETLAARLL